MRWTSLLSAFCVFVVPAYAQTSGSITQSPFTPMVQPVTGYASYDFAGPSASIPGRDMQRAQGFIASGNFAEADKLLGSLIGKTSSRQVRFLKGVAKLGLNDAEAARRYFEQSLYTGRNGHPGAMSGLALAEIRLGNRDAARDILQKLRYQQEKCGSDCDRAKPLDQAVSVVEKALI
ncbi:tetratricopeptide repeat protein [Sphingobium sp. TCM1]|uniref:tetratricopeptide repeat protein n=1 Tax=Sphingobium sp. TCM1 TaxID=453246 RepID=UPI000A88EE31|nr:tetratricopeptide repeat protein [Sphingobium sp. TCM1]